MRTTGVQIVIDSNTRGFSAGAKRVMGELDKLSSHAEKLPGFNRFKDLLTNPLVAATSAATGLVVAMSKVVANAERLRDISVQIGGSLKQAQGIQYGAAVTGLSQDQLVRSVSELRKSAGEAQAGSKEKLQSFRDLGISPETLASGSPVDLFQTVLKRFQGGSSSAREFAAANKILGESFRELLPGIQRGLPGALGGGRWFDSPDNEIQSAEDFGAGWRSMWANTWGGIRRGGSYLMHGAVGMGRLGAAALLSPFGTTEGSAAMLAQEDLLTRRHLQFNPGAGPGTQVLEARLMQAQQRRAFVDQLNAANRTSAAELEFNSLSPAAQLNHLLSAQYQGHLNRSSMNPAQAAMATAGMIKLEGSIRDLKEKLLEELRKQTDALTQETD